MELIQHYNARIRPGEAGVKESALSRHIEVDNCVVRSDDYGSVLEHVLSNFANIVGLNHDVGTLYLQNPPKRVLQSLLTVFKDIASTDILEWFKNNANRYDNIRILKGKLENAIFDELTCRFVINNSDQ